MKKFVLMMLCALLLTSLVPGHAAGQPVTTRIEGTLTRSIPLVGRNADGSFPDNPVIEGESSTTGLPLSNEEYIPILVQIDNNLGAIPQWGIADADIMYETPIQGGGWTRLTAFFADKHPEETGPDRSARIMHADIREEWDATLVHFGQQEAVGSDVREVFRDYGVNKKGLNIDGIGNRYKAYFQRVKYHPAPHNVTVYVKNLAQHISQLNYPFPVRPFAFTDSIAYAGPDAQKIDIKHGTNSDTVSSFVYDKLSNGYERYTKKGLFGDLLKPEYRIIYNNVIIQRTPLTYNNSTMNPLLRDIVGQGAADIFIGGKYIAGVWARNSLKERTVFFDQNGKEIQLQRGKTWITLADVDTMVTFDDIVNYREGLVDEEILLANAPQVATEAKQDTDVENEYLVVQEGSAFATAQDKDFTYRTTAGGLAIISGYTGSDTDVVVPATIGGVPVAAIGHAAFINQDTLTSIALPEGLYMIGDSAFKNCRSANTINIPSTVCYIGANAFENCYAMTSAVVPEGVVALEDRTFLNSKALTELSLPKSLQSIGVASLAGLEKLPVLDLPKNIKTIGMGAFACNNALTHITLPNSIEEIGYSAFHGCAGLKEVVLPVGIREVAGGMFYDCPQLEKVFIPVTARRLDTSMLFTNSPNVQVHSFANSAAQGVARELKVPFVAVDPISQVALKTGERTVTDSVVAIDLSGDERTLQLVADVTPDSPWSELSWTSSSPKVATVDAYGIVTGHKSGVAKITASTMDGSRVSASCKVNVAHLVHEITVSGDADLQANESTVLKAEAFPEDADDKKVIWSSSHPDIAKVSKQGKVSAAKKVPAITQVTITAEAKDGSGVVGKHIITITPIAYDIQLSANGRKVEKKDKLGIDLLSGNPTLQLSAQVIPADAPQQVTWKSSKPKVATVNENGLVTGLEKGTTTITVSTFDGSKVKAEYKVNVANLAKEVTISGSNAVAAGRSIMLSASVLPENTDNKGVVWTSSDETIATVGNDGKVIGKRSDVIRNVQITATAKDGSGVQAVHQVSVHPIATDVAILKDNQKAEGKTNIVIDLSKDKNTLQLAAAVLPQEAAQVVEWKSSSPATVSVDENGLLTAHKNGKVTITAAAMDGSRKRTTVTVEVVTSMKELTLTGESRVKAGGWTRLKAVYWPETVSNKDLVWTSSDTTVATVTKEGVVNAKKVKEEKKVTITATAKDGSGVTASFEIVVQP